MGGAAFDRMLSRESVAGSTLEMPLPKSWQAQHSVHLGVFSVAGAAFNRMLWRAQLGARELVAGAALWRCRRRQRRNRGRRSLLCIWIVWPGQRLAAVYARGTRNRGRRSTLEMPLPKSGQAQHSVHPPPSQSCLLARRALNKWTLKGAGYLASGS